MCGSKSPEELGHFRRDCRPGLARRRIVAVLKVRGNHGAGLRFGAERLHLTRAFPPILGRRLPRHVDLSNPTDLAMTAMEAHGLRPVLAGLRPSRSAVATSPATLHLSLLRDLERVVNVDFPRYLTVLSSFACPSSSRTARRFLVLR